ncbi:MAG: histidine phosphatase family protein [Clostridiales Family XIII bacterium]|jgi:broad specificity phosphatase PhoE/CTP:molybdopterin cytidylyltransferase MocA|nr:histidine phosphatase family protein [Clostridiales Family XIII bacterium]
MTAEAVGIVLAAGYSSRMGGFKPLLDIGGRPALARAIGSLRRAGAGRAVVVTGHGRELIAGLIAEQGAAEAWNPRFAEGMFSSVRAGLEKAAELCGRDPVCLLLPADCPMASPRSIEALLAAGERMPGRFIAPCYRGKKGHPLLIPPEFAGEIRGYGGEGGLKALTRLHEDRMELLETGDEGVVLDMDTPEGYGEMAAFCEGLEGFPEGAAPPDALDGFAGGIFLIRHGEIEAHEEKIFLGQTDAPLSEAGRGQALGAARELAALGARVDAIYSSDLARAAETARIMAGWLNGGARRGGAPVAVREDPRLRELDLGSWDGRPISEIKRLYPDEYARRGAGLAGWKRSGGENFYDLRYRAGKALRAAAAATAAAGGGPDLALVCHGGTIKALVSELSGADIVEALGLEVPRGGVIRAR